VSLWSLKNRMLELSTSGSVGGAVGNHCFYPAADSAFGAGLYRRSCICTWSGVEVHSFHPALRLSFSVSAAIICSAN
jgi:hypothetical protein